MRFFSSLRNKIMLSTAVVAVLISLVLTWQSGRRLKGVVYQQMEAEGGSLASSLAASAGQSMLMKDVAALQTSLNAYKDKKGVAWAYLVNEKGELEASSLEGKIPADLASRNKPEGDKMGVATMEINGKEALEMAAPILGGALGSAHVGMDKDSAEQVIASQNWSALLTVLLALGGALAVLWFLLERMIGPISSLTAVVKKIVEEGDLTQKIPVESEDEVGRLAKYFADMVERLRRVPLELGKSAETLRQAVEALEDATAEQNSTVTRQATALQETQVTAEEIKQTSQSAARSAQGILEATQRADEIGRQGEQSVEQSLQALSEMRAQSAQIAARVSELGERTRQIGDITGTVKELADQSNMLALNAAIEAVRAGEHGKGFSLVAREIRRLADQSIQATNRVREILDSVSSAAAAAVKNTESGAARIEVGLSQARVSGDHLKTLAGMVRDNSAAVRQIASAVNQQNTGVGQVFSAVMDQSRMMDDTVRQLENTVRNVETLKQVSRSVLEVVKSYKV
jgi:methyl-accepting chemotaxis protein